MQFIEFLEKLLGGRGFYAIFMVIYSWSSAVILFVILIYEIFLYIFKAKFTSRDLKNNIDNKGKND